MYYLIASATGLIVACAEIMSRYKAAPLKAVSTMWGAIYLAINAALSLLAFQVLIFIGTVTETMSSSEILQYALFAGFGAMVIIRAKLFNVKLSSGESVSVGPDFVVDTFLNFLDREIDRTRAIRRVRTVKEVMTNIDYEKVKLPLITLMTRSMQNITETELSELGKKVAELDSLPMLAQEKAYALGFLMLDLAGEYFLLNVFNESERKKYIIEDEAISGTESIGNNQTEGMSSEIGGEERLSFKPLPWGLMFFGFWSVLRAVETTSLLAQGMSIFFLILSGVLLLSFFIKLLSHFIKCNLHTNITNLFQRFNLEQIQRNILIFLLVLVFFSTLLGVSLNVLSDLGELSSATDRSIAIVGIFLYAVAYLFAVASIASQTGRLGQILVGLISTLMIINAIQNIGTNTLAGSILITVGVITIIIIIVRPTNIHLRDLI